MGIEQCINQSNVAAHPRSRLNHDHTPSTRCQLDGVAVWTVCGLAPDPLLDVRTGKKNKKNKSVLKQMKKAKKKAKKQAKKQARKAAEACEDAVEAVEDAVEDVVEKAEDVAKAVVAAAERTMEELQEMAKRAFKKILEAAANAMVAAAQDVGTWARDDLKIPVPGRVEVNQSSRSHEDGVEDDATLRCSTTAP